MLGAIIGDIVGSVYEFDNIKTKDFPLFRGDEFYTDDTVMTCAVAEALMDRSEGTLEQKAVKWMRKLGRRHPGAGYGGRCAEWLKSEDPRPYNSYGNGSAMRVSPCGLIAKTLEEAASLSKKVTAITHDHPEGIKGAEATATCVCLAKHHWTKEGILYHVRSRYYPMDFTLDEIRPTYKFNETCQKTVPQALQAFFESTSFEDALRNAVSVGGDTDTLAAITCSVAGAFYGIDRELKEKALSILPEDLKKTCEKWEKFIATRS
ncbi:MAG: ADP-ribosylglycohydrolase family protein [Clostridia bacterium]|nr:ADP-ribosylglycohydrolase family protein [Clostridia bacterium]